ncbi:D-alanyl-D-alanine carboxypeptidase/D-alanyl-D-alanine endopeptidase [Ideonella sp. BN130291]|uniref:D-alanyl-D-alanine carboxypeptidase/D-alanyl-D-alanine endopeptidase n=1 Tax=Ideonella sp. BN130291 TaxID=3112940 RepID=UPI002E25AB14|nr:D-alanyl-D-alanine carboxypeptidase/D-alanyl-D-alanine-endopeptidase [Ideonella sp. BN130291]
MLRSLLRTLVLLLVPAFVSAASAQPLPREVAQALKRAEVPRDALAVVVQEVAAGRSLPPPRLVFNASQPMNPASLFKLVTTAAALDLLGPAYTWQTPLWLQGRLDNGVLHGSLVIRGSGDPKLVVERLWLLMQRLRQQGLQEIDGDIVLDRSLFTEADMEPGAFDGEPLRPYNVRADALLLNYKSVRYTFTPDPAHGVARISVEPALAQVIVDAAVPLDDGPCTDWRAQLKANFADPVHARFEGRYAAGCGERQWPVAHAEPGRYNARLLEALWRDSGGRLRGSVREGSAPVDSPPSLVVESPPLADVVRDINKFSNNVMAQQLFLTLGAVQAGRGSPDTARQALQRWIAQRFGEAAASATVIDNGSGLSRDTRVSAALLARLLQQAYAGPAMPELMSSLPVSGLDGTLRNAAGLPAGRAHLKTGSLRDVAGVAGYVLAASGKRYLLVALINHPHAQAARGALDAVVQWTYDD